MKIALLVSKFMSAIALVLGLCTSVLAADLPEIQARGELRHLGIRYANFVTGAGDGLDVELVQGFAQHLGVKYQLVYSNFYDVIRDLLGKDVVRNGADVSLSGNFPVKGDIIATGFTVLPWREAVLLYSEPTFPSQVLLVAPAKSPLKPIEGSADLASDIRESRALIGNKSLLVMERTCLDPANYGLKGVGIDLKAYTKSANLNEMVPALLNGEAELTLLDVPDVILDLKKWAGKSKSWGRSQTIRFSPLPFRRTLLCCVTPLTATSARSKPTERMTRWSINIHRHPALFSGFLRSESLNYGTPQIHCSALADVHGRGFFSLHAQRPMEPVLLADAVASRYRCPPYRG